MKDLESQYTIGAVISADDGRCGTLTRIVIDPVAEVVTHLVVQPMHHRGPPRLVPLDLIEPGRTEHHLRLHGTVVDFSRLDPAEETHFVPPQAAPAPAGFTDFQPALVWRYYGGSAELPDVMDGMVTTAYLPVGEVDVRRGDSVHATDGEIGRVMGLAVSQSDRHVTHVLLEEGHLFGRQEVAIPISAITSVAEGVQLSLTMEQVRDLPPVDHDRCGV